jgi:two-component system sensor histidine kinase BaeS
VWSPSLRTRLVASFVGVVGIGTFLAAFLTVVVVHRTFDSYLDRRADQATRSAVQSAQETYATAGGAWTTKGLDGLAHDLALTGYDFRLVEGPATLVDTTRSTPGETPLARVAREPVRDASGREVATLEVYALRGGGSTPADADFRGELDRVHLIAAAISSLLAIILGLLLARRLTGPLRRLAAVARSLGQAHSANPVTASGPPEIRDLGLALAGLADSLERQQRSRRQLAQDLAHELRTPLTLVRSRIEAMQDGVVPFDTDGLDALHAEVLRLQRLIGEIERLAEIEARPRTMETCPVALDALAKDVAEGSSGAFETAGVALRVDAAPTRAMADPDAVRQIATNLVSNALKYTPPGGRVELHTYEEADRAILAVSDTGPGIDTIEAERVFDRFYRGSGARNPEDGMGLGLTIARDLANAQGGHLAHRPTTAGATFVLSLPLSGAETREKGTSDESRPRPDPTGRATA